MVFEEDNPGVLWFARRHAVAFSIERAVANIRRLADIAGIAAQTARLGCPVCANGRSTRRSATWHAR